MKGVSEGWTWAKAQGGMQASSASANKALNGFLIPGIALPP
jgi:hypothetical protein